MRQNTHLFSKLMKRFNKYLLDSLYFYYKECEKHIKKKKSRIGSISRKPTTVGQSNQQKNSSELCPQGWLVRYDFKLAIFAEFRQDAEYTQRYCDTEDIKIIDILIVLIKTWRGC